MTIGLVVALGCAAVLALLLSELTIRGVERRLLYHPARELRGSPADLGLTFEEVALETADGERLHAFWLPSGGPHTVLYCHGNGGNVSDWLDKSRALVRAGLSVLLFDYRGFGRSTGTPSDNGLFRDAEAAYLHLVRERRVRPEELVLWGNSLGGPVAARLARDLPCRALLIEGSPVSTRAMAARVLPWLPGAVLFSRARFDTVDFVRACRVPLLVIHGDTDPLVPFAMGRAIWEASGEPRRFLAVRDAGHSDGWIVGGRGYLDAVLRFISDPLDGLPPAPPPAPPDGLERGRGGSPLTASPPSR